MKILVTGTPGVGKTTFSKMVEKEHKIRHIDVTAYIREAQIYDEYDAKFDTYLFDVDKVREHLNATAESTGSFIIDTHSPAVAMDIRFDFIFHLKCDTGVLYQRLRSRGYPEAKVSENLDCECLDMVGEELEEYIDGEPLCVSGSGGPADCGTMSASDALAMLKDRGDRISPEGRGPG